VSRSNPLVLKNYCKDWNVYKSIQKAIANDQDRRFNSEYGKNLPFRLFSRGEAFENYGDKESFMKQYQIVADNAKSSIIIERNCLDCINNHKLIYYKRIRNMVTFDAYTNLIE
jgi:hypothetical protein